MDVTAMMTGAQEALTVRRVFGEPIERDGLTVVPVAYARGASGGGSGQDTTGNGGGGGGFAVSVRPAGVYVISDGSARWVPAVNPVPIVVAGTATGAVVAMALGRALRFRASRPAFARTAATIRALARSKAAGRRR